MWIPGVISLFRFSNTGKSFVQRVPQQRCVSSWECSLYFQLHTQQIFIFRKVEATYFLHDLNTRCGGDNKRNIVAWIGCTNVFRIIWPLDMILQLLVAAWAVVSKLKTERKTLHILWCIIRTRGRCVARAGKSKLLALRTRRVINLLGRFVPLRV